MKAIVIMGNRFSARTFSTLQSISSWVDLYIFNRLIPMLFFLHKHFRLNAVLALTANRELVKNYPKLKYKYLRQNYLYSSLARSDAIDAMITHYSSIQKYTRPGFVSKIFQDKIVLWSFHMGEKHFQIYLTFPRDFNHPDRMHDNEGDLGLVFEMEGSPIYALCMTIIPKRLLESDFTDTAAERAMFVGRVQGVPGAAAKLKEATKALLDIAPPRLLICAVEAISHRLGIKTIGGVCNNQQLSRDKCHEPDTFFDYDSFWTTLGARKKINGLFAIGSPILEKPIDEVQQNHRSRTLKKRKFRQDVKESIYFHFSKETSREA